jgi:hypothetical protein
LTKTDFWFGWQAAFAIVAQYFSKHEYNILSNDAHTKKIRGGNLSVNKISTINCSLIQLTLAKTICGMCLLVPKIIELCNTLLGKIAYSLLY